MNKDLLSNEKDLDKGFILRANEEVQRLMIQVINNIGDTKDKEFDIMMLDEKHGIYG